MLNMRLVLVLVTLAQFHRVQGRRDGKEECAADDTLSVEQKEFTFLTEGEEERTDAENGAEPPPTPGVGDIVVLREKFQEARGIDLKNKRGRVRSVKGTSSKKELIVDVFLPLDSLPKCGKPPPSKCKVKLDKVEGTKTRLADVKGEMTEWDTIKRYWDKILDPQGGKVFNEPSKGEETSVWAQGEVKGTVLIISQLMMPIKIDSNNIPRLKVEQEAASTVLDPLQAGQTDNAALSDAGQVVKPDSKAFPKKDEMVTVKGWSSATYSVTNEAEVRKLPNGAFSIDVRYAKDEAFANIALTGKSGKVREVSSEKLTIDVSYPLDPSGVVGLQKDAWTSIPNPDEIERSADQKVFKSFFEKNGKVKVGITSYKGTKDGVWGKFKGTKTPGGKYYVSELRLPIRLPNDEDACKSAFMICTLPKTDDLEEACRKDVKKNFVVLEKFKEKENLCPEKDDVVKVGDKKAIWHGAKLHQSIGKVVDDADGQLIVNVIYTVPKVSKDSMSYPLNRASYVAEEENNFIFIQNPFEIKDAKNGMTHAVWRSGIKGLRAKASGKDDKGRYKVDEVELPIEIAIGDALAQAKLEAEAAEAEVKAKAEAKAEAKAAAEEQVKAEAEKRAKAKAGAAEAKEEEEAAKARAAAAKRDALAASHKARAEEKAAAEADKPTPKPNPKRPAPLVRKTDSAPPSPAGTAAAKSQAEAKAKAEEEEDGEEDGEDEGGDDEEGDDEEGDEEGDDEEWDEEGDDEEWDEEDDEDDE